MQCVKVYAPGDYRLEECPIPEVGEEEVLVRVLAVGVCSSDAKCFAGAAYYWGSDSLPKYIQPPVIPGHEFVGEVTELGPGAGEKFGLKVGDHATAENIVPCWECRFCREGHYNICIPHDVFGYHQRSQGAMATYMKYPKGALVHKVPKNIPAWQAAFTEPLACSVYAVQLADITATDTVVVSGCGPLGLGMVAAARLKKPQKLIALDLLDWKLPSHRYLSLGPQVRGSCKGQLMWTQPQCHVAELDVAKKCGADVVLNPSKCDIVKEVKALTEGYGCDVYIEATGHPQSVRQGLQVLIKRGRFIEYGVFGKETSADWTIISNVKELTIKGGHLSPNTYPAAISMLEKGLLPMKDIITHQLKFSQIHKGIEMVTRSTESIKVVLVPDN